MSRPSFASLFLPSPSVAFLPSPSVAFSPNPSASPSGKLSTELTEEVKSSLGSLSLSTLSEGESEKSSSAADFSISRSRAIVSRRTFSLPAYPAPGTNPKISRARYSRSSSSFSISAATTLPPRFASRFTTGASAFFFSASVAIAFSRAEVNAKSGHAHSSFSRANPSPPKPSTAIFKDSARASAKNVFRVSPSASVAEASNSRQIFPAIARASTSFSVTAPDSSEASNPPAFSA